MRVIFTAFDNVLNSECFFLKRNRNMRDIRLIETNPRTEDERLVQWHLYNLDLDNVELLKNIAEETDSKIVVTSSWKELKCFKGICKELIKRGLPIIGATKDNGYDRGKGIKDYIENHEVEDYIILDDQIFDDYDSEMIKHLFMLKFNASGLMEEESNQVKKLLKKK